MREISAGALRPAYGHRVSNANAQTALSIADIRASTARTLRGLLSVIGQLEDDESFCAQRDEAMTLVFHFTCSACHLATMASRIAQVSSGMPESWHERLALTVKDVLLPDGHTRGLATLRKLAGALGAFDGLFEEFEDCCRESALAGRHSLLSDADFDALLSA